MDPERRAYSSGLSSASLPLFIGHGFESALAADRAATGIDARSQAARALALNPLDQGVQGLAHALARGPSKRARQAGLAFLSQQSLIVSG